MIDDLIQPTGISARPIENSLKELARRAKNLDRELIFKILYEKLASYESLSDTNGQKVLLVKKNIKINFYNIISVF